MGSITVGCDVGGTFTDLILLDRASDQIRIAKVPTTPANQAEGVLAAMSAASAVPADIDSFMHGTTATTNALLERKLARCGLITTRGFRDLLELGRRTRPHPYGLIGHFEPLISRELRYEVDERIDAQGIVVRPISVADVEAAIKQLIGKGAEAVVIHFLHSYVNPTHELEAAEIARRLWPNSYITVGHELVSEQREYERGVTAAVNGCVQPILHRYIERLGERLASEGFRKDFLVMQGNGGTAASRVIARTAVHTVMSGPASGVVAAAATALAAGFRNVISYDMGGTSTDVALIQDGAPLVSSELELEYGMPIHIPMVNVHTVGAGGGSIAKIDDAGFLRIGPESAGATPGPICFHRGGVLPTITDANLVLGRLNPDRLLAVDRPVQPEMVARRIEETIGAPLGIDGVQAAAAMIRVGNDRMAGAIRMVSLGRGYDPRDFCLVAFGGAGPLHAAALARELSIPTVLVPALPGLTNALGCLVSDLRHDFVRTLNKPVNEIEASDIRTVLDQQEEQGRALIRQEADADIAQIEIRYRADMQFEGQSHVLSFDFTDAEANPSKLLRRFAEAYWARFQVDLAEIKPVLVSLHTIVIGQRPQMLPSRLAAGRRAKTLAQAESNCRRVWFDGGFVETPIYQRDRLPLEITFHGPAILEQIDATTVVEPGNRVDVDRHGNVVLTVEESRHAGH